MSPQEIFEKHPHWQDIVEVTRTLQSHGHHTLLAGGCIRDALLGVSPHDFDVATSATPDEVVQIFPKSLQVGAQFGVIILPRSGYQIEIATFRHDGEYKDGRRPESVSYTRNPQLDAERRDFTVNALFYDIQKQSVIDYVGGLKDLQACTLRTVGDPKRRFDEDKLRLLRAARFAAQLNFQIEKDTFAAVKALSSKIKNVSIERITEEFQKLSRTQNLKHGFIILKDTGLLATIWPHLTNTQDDKSWNLLLRSSELLSSVRSYEALLATLLLLQLFYEYPEANQSNNRSHEQIDMLIGKLIERVPLLLTKEQKKILRFLLSGFFVMRESEVEYLLYLNEEHGPLLTEFCHHFSMIGLFESSRLQSCLDRFLMVADENGELPAPYLNGEDLKRLGIQPSPQMGELLRDSYLAQIRGEIRSKKEAQDWVLGRFESP